MEQALIDQYNSELTLMKQKNQNDMAYANSMYNQVQKQNIVEWELDFSTELLDIERLLRCDVLVRDKDGNVEWQPNPDKSKVFLNDLGVNDVLRIIKLVVNKNKVLSNYTIEEIKDRTRMIGHEIRMLIYNNYEMYDIDNEYKMHNYPMVVISILPIVEDCYRRALGGEAHKGLNQQRIVTQSESLAPQQNYSRPSQSKSHWYNPLSYFKK